MIYGGIIVAICAAEFFVRRRVNKIFQQMKTGRWADFRFVCANTITKEWQIIRWRKSHSLSKASVSVL